MNYHKSASDEARNHATHLTIVTRNVNISTSFIEGGGSVMFLVIYPFPFFLFFKIFVRIFLVVVFLYTRAETRVYKLVWNNG